MREGVFLGRKGEEQTGWQGLSGSREKTGLLVKEGRKESMRAWKKKKSAKVLFCYVEIRSEMRCWESRE